VTGARLVDGVAVPIPFRTVTVRLRCTAEERDRLVAAARAAGVSLSEWLRARGLA